MDDREIRPILEALLFVAAEPLPLKKLCELLDGVERDRVVSSLDALRTQYREGGHGIDLVELAGGYQLVTVAEAAPWLRKLSAVKSPSKLSKPALETLAIIAYRQPLTRPEVEAIRGVDVAGVVKTLMDRRLVKIVGRKDVPGRPMMFGTTKEFLQAFGLNDLADLPSMQDFSEIADSLDTSVDALDAEGSSQLMLEVDETAPVRSDTDRESDPVSVGPVDSDGTTIDDPPSDPSLP